MSLSLRAPEPLLDDADLTPAQRNFRLNWVSHRERSRRGEPVLCPEFVCHQGRGVRIVDVRGADELVGPHGYIPGVDWLPHADLGTLRTLPHDEPLVLVSRDGEAAAALAKQLEDAGFRMVAAMKEGIVGWRHFGFAVSRTPDVLLRKGELRRIEPDPDDGSRLTLLEIEEHAGNPFEVKWVRMAGLLLQGRHHCVDGRDDSGIVGTPGGDAGEFLTLLACMEAEFGIELDHATLGKLFHHTLDAFGAFYMHTDVASTETMLATMAADARLAAAVAAIDGPVALRAFLARPPVELREALLEHLLRADHQGCGHLKLMWKNPSEYGVRPALVVSFLRHFFESRWAGAEECEHVVLAGEHDEKGVLLVKLEDEIFPFTQIPLVAPTCHNSQMFVAHPQVASYYRGQLAEFLCRLPDTLVVDAARAPSVRSRSDALSEQQTLATLKRLAKGLPIFEVVFGRDGRVDVRYVGDVPSA